MPLSSVVEQRIQTGQATQHDAQWLQFLSELFANTPIAALVLHGMESDHARRLIDLLALAPRTLAEVPENAP